MPDYTKLSIAEIEAEISAAQCALDAKRAEPDYERFREALFAGRKEMHPTWSDRFSGHLGEFDKATIRGLIAAYPALKRAMEGDKPDDGWIEWEGGECPVPRGTRVDIEFRNGQVHKNLLASSWSWEEEKGYTIARYRVLP